jgi:hypothetical protein
MPLSTVRLTPKKPNLASDHHRAMNQIWQKEPLEIAANMDLIQTPLMKKDR